MLADIVNQIMAEYGNRFMVGPTEILRLLDQVHKRAIAYDCRAFRKQTKLTVVVDSRGPYAYPSDCRRAVRVLCVDSGDDIMDGFNVAPSRFNLVDRTVILGSAAADGDDYWLDYYVRPSTISALTDDSKLLVPDEWHHAVLVCGVAILADQENYGGVDAGLALEKVLQPFWSAMDALSDGMAPVISSGSW